jgi:hypothetical protein
LRKRNALRLYLRLRVALMIAPEFGDMGTYEEGYLQGIRMARAAIPGDVDQPALKALDELYDRVKEQQNR